MEQKLKKITSRAEILVWCQKATIIIIIPNVSYSNYDQGLRKEERRQLIPIKECSKRAPRLEK